MAKSIFTIIFLVVALVVTSKIQSFVKNNQPIKIPEVIEEPFVIDFPVDDLLDATSTDPFSTSTPEQI
jgi:hypothetical protein